MQFRLIYQGELVSQANSRRVHNKNAIRRQLHDQLERLWRNHPLLQKWSGPPPAGWSGGSPDGIIIRRLTDYNCPLPHGTITFADSLGTRYERAGIIFVPLVNEVFGLVCELDILFLRREKPGTFVTQGGDIDNRIKVLLDALRVPKNVDEMKSTGADIRKFYCLLADDALVTRLNINTDRLLTRPPTAQTHPEADVHLIIHVTVKTDADKLTGLQLL